jgi:hypothetical protein
VLGAGRQGAGMGWEYTLWWVGIVALLGGSLKVPGLLIDAKEVRFTPSEDLVDGATFLWENPVFAIIGLAIVTLLFMPKDNPGDYSPDPIDGGGGDYDSAASYRDMLDQLDRGQQPA